MSYIPKPRNQTIHVPTEAEWAEATPMTPAELSLSAATERERKGYMCLLVDDVERRSNVISAIIHADDPQTLVCMLPAKDRDGKKTYPDFLYLRDIKRVILLRDVVFAYTC